MKKVSSVKEIKENLKSIIGKVLYLFDIDNTIITTKSNFGPKIDKLKEIREINHERKEIDRMISAWRIYREVILTDDDWPAFLQNIDRPYAITKMDVGRFGEIPSVENWRNNELAKLGIKFNPICPIDGKVYSEPDEIEVENATFFNGIFYTGDALKGSIVKRILKNNSYDLVVFIDDRLDQLEDVGRDCESLGITYLPMQFELKRKHYQKQSLVERDCEKIIIDFINSNK